MAGNKTLGARCFSVLFLFTTDTVVAIILKQPCCQINRKVDEEPIFCERLRTWRKKAGLSQEQAAAQLGVSRSYLNEVENGREPGRKLVNSLAVAQRPKFDYSTNEGARKAFEWLIETMPLRELIERVNAMLRDETNPLNDRLQIANLINPVIERRKREIESQALESRKPVNYTTAPVKE